eukprot:TRINITY_DN9850_c0_g1_i1.p1 TRINITY_DN9850_c0_g1~~TRINITY_DN9850_c0_g1_i1.p1  ORF type:complete len:331 (+),score=44.85 TRINITY_DN9850_c0_g1_i1:150-995(+)
MAYRKGTWSLLSHGEGDVAEDQPTEFYGTRGTQWMRLQHSETKSTLLFVNHHGPLSVNSGGQCGGVSTARNLLQLIKAKGETGDMIVLVGDFNANAASLTIQELWRYLVLVYNGQSFGGVDNIFTNMAMHTVSDVKTLGSGGSDHDAISATIERESKLYYKEAMRSSSGHVEPSKAVADSAHSQCGLLESDVEYQFEGYVWTRDFDDVSDPRSCCSLCARDGRCRAWTLTSWVPSIAGQRCSLKGSSRFKRVPREGVVSGLTAREEMRHTAEAARFAISDL